MNETIQALNEVFWIHHAKSTPYHPHANGAVEAFNKILEQALKKVYNADHAKLYREPSELADEI